MQRNILMLISLRAKTQKTLRLRASAVHSSFFKKVLLKQPGCSLLSLFFVTFNHVCML